SASAGKADVVRYLTEHGADVNAVNDTLSTALHRACTLGHLEFARLLLEKGKARISPTDGLGNTPLHLAAEEEHRDVCTLLLQKKAPLYILNRSKETPADM
ncbi:ankyrin repeat-containing domain protein, partial [Piptocephalis cylindrospora]